MLQTRSLQALLYKWTYLLQLLKIASALGVSINEFLSFEISTVGDVLSILMRLDEQTDMDITGEKDENGNYIPDSISFSFSNENINNALVAYLTYRDKKTQIPSL